MSRIHAKAVLFYLAIATLAGASLLYGRWIAATRSATPIRPVLHVNSADLEIGEVWETNRLSHQLPITNTSNQAITIGSFTISCPCVTSHPSSLTLDPGQTRTIALSLDLVNRFAGGASPSLTPRDWNVTIRPNYSSFALQSGDPWQLNGKVRTAITCRPPSLRFSEGSVVDGELVYSSRFAVLAHDGIDDIVIRHTSDWIGRVEVLRDPHSERAFSVTIEAVAGLTVGPRTSTISIVPRLNGTDLPEVPYVVTVNVVGDIELVPPALQGGVVGFGMQRTDNVRIRSRTNRALSVVSCESSSDSVNAKIVAADCIEVTISEPKSGLQSEVVTIVVRAEGHHEIIKLPYAVHYYGELQKDE